LGVLSDPLVRGVKMCYTLQSEHTVMLIKAFAGWGVFWHVLARRREELSAGL
jgi:hypothetical protein